jgi:biopolymer transport protein ExbD
MRMRKREYISMADINVTNLVDVVLVLLIIFMISAPLLQSGIEVDLPKTKTAALSEEAEGVVVTIKENGGVVGMYINDVWTRMDDFEKELDKELSRLGKSSVYLRADSLIPYGRVVDVIGRLKIMGVDDLGLITAGEENNDRKR